MSEINCYRDEIVYGEVLPGWTLVRLINKINKPYFINFTQEMKEGNWGLSYCNDPDFVFEYYPMSEPSTEEVDDPSWSAYWRMLNHYQTRLTGPVLMGHKLVQAAIQVGYDLEEGGFAGWLSDRMYQHLQKLNFQPVAFYERVK